MLDIGTRRRVCPGAPFVPTLPFFPSRSERANRRRLVVFAGTFALVLIVGMVWNYTRPAIYLASARVQVNPGAVQTEAAVSTGGTQGANTSRSLLSELQVLTSKPLVQTVTAALSPGQQAVVKGLGADPIAVLQAGLEARVAEGTDVVELSSRGPDADLAASLVNGLILSYKTQLEGAYSAVAGESLAQINDEVEKLEARVKAKREQIEAFRVRHNIVSLEREENDALGRVKGQTDALNKAQERVAQAEGKLGAVMRRQQAQQQAAVRASAQPAPPRADPVLQDLEKRASALREELAELNRQYTPAYLDLDPKVRAQRNRLAELERQIVQQRQTAQQAQVTERREEQTTAHDLAVADAQEELTAAKAALDRMQREANAGRGALHQFSARFNEYRTLTSELAPVENLLKDAVQRKARLEAGERARRPSIRVLESAVPPRDAWQPHYTQDAFIVFGAALALALLAMWIVELFNKEEPQPTMVVAQPVAVTSFGPAQAAGPMLGSGGVPVLDALPGGGAATPPAQLAAPLNAPRELLPEEVGLLLDNLSPAGQWVAHLLLRGLSLDEALALRATQIDTDRRLVHVGDPAAPSRSLPLDDGLLARIAPISGANSQELATAIAGKSYTSGDFAQELLYAAHDAGLQGAEEVSATALRHTAAAHLARQGLKLAELAKVIGPLDAEQARLYSALAPVGRRLSLDEVAQRLLPGLG